MANRSGGRNAAIHRASARSRSDSTSPSQTAERGLPRGRRAERRGRRDLGALLRQRGQAHDLLRLRRARPRRRSGRRPCATSCPSTRSRRCACSTPTSTPKEHKMMTKKLAVGAVAAGMLAIPAAAIADSAAVGATALVEPRQPDRARAAVRSCAHCDAAGRVYDARALGQAHAAPRAATTLVPGRRAQLGARARARRRPLRLRGEQLRALGLRARPRRRPLRRHLLAPAALGACARPPWRPLRVLRRVDDPELDEADRDGHQASGAPSWGFDWGSAGIGAASGHRSAGARARRDQRTARPAHRHALWTLTHPITRRSPCAPPASSPPCSPPSSSRPS